MVLPAWPLDTTTGEGEETDRGRQSDTVDIGVLGSLELVVAGRVATPSGTRERKLLALLAVSANTVVPLDRIVGVLWDDPPDSARQQVHNVVSTLRRILAAAGGRVELVTTSAGYQFTAARSTVDALRFQAGIRESERAEEAGRLDEAVDILRRALGQWRGPALDGLHGQVLMNASTMLNDQRLAAAEHLAELQLLRGDAVTSAADLAGLLALSPFRESLRAVLMRALHQGGRQADALAVFEEGRRLLAEELGLDPGPLLREAQRRILSGEAGPGPAAPPRSGAAAPAAGAGRLGRSYLPRDIAEFTGREEEVRRLIADAGRTGANAPVISVIDGMGGVGKTTLAVHLAHHFSAEYPDGQYFVDLAGFSAGATPMTVLDALNLLLRGSEVPPELIPSDLEGRSALWRSRLAGNRVLLLLDNAADTAQIRPLLPGAPGALVLISSRRRMTSLQGALPLSLDVMTRPEAVALFSQIVGTGRVAAEPEATSAAVELCGRLPLAIQIAAARFRERTSWPVAHLVEQLTDQRGRARFLATGDRDVMTVLAWSYDHLTGDQQRLFRLLSLLAGPDFDAYAVAALADLPLDEAEISLTELFEVNLLKQHLPGRYHLHDLVRDSSRSLAEKHGDAVERGAATLRMVDYFLRSASAWCAPMTKAVLRTSLGLTQGPRQVKEADSSGAGIKLLDQEYPNLVAATRSAAEAGLHTQTWQLAYSLLPYFGMLNYSGEAESLIELALSSARAAGSRKGEASCLTCLASVKRSRAAHEEARELIKRALELSRRDGDLAGEVWQLTDLGVMYMEGSLFDEAHDCYTAALKLAREIGDRQVQADLTNNLGIISRELGRLDEAIAFFEQTRALDEDRGVLQPQIATLNNIGQVMCIQGRHEDAVAQYGESLALSRTAASGRGEAFALVGLCIARRMSGALDDALTCGREALDLARSLHMYDVEGQALNAIGDTYLSLGDLDTAQRVFTQAGELAAASDSTRYAARAYEGLAHVASARGDREEAEELWRQSLATYPGGVVDANGARRHLAAPELGAAVCWRCSRLEAGSAEAAFARPPRQSSAPSPRE